MKVSLFILSISMLSTICLGPGISSGAQLLSDDDLDQVTAAGTSWSVDILPTNLVLGTIPTTGVGQATSSILTPALSSVSAAAASAEAARAVSGIAGLVVATDAVSTAATALESASIATGLDSLNAGQATLTAAASILNSVPLEQHTPEIIEAATKVSQAATNLNQTALNKGAINLNEAWAAIEHAKVAISGLPDDVGGGVDHSTAIDAAVNSIQTAKDAINAAAQSQTASTGGSQTFVLKENGDGSLDPVLRINFTSGRTVGSADIIPLVTGGGAPHQPNLNLDGAALVNGTLPITLIAETLMMNLNICFYCIADKIIQNNNGYVVPIYAR